MADKANTNIDKTNGFSKYIKTYMDWRNTAAALEAFGDEVKTRLENEILERDHVVSGNLFNNIRTRVEITEDNIILWLEIADYFKYLEEGIEPAGKYKNPGWKAYPFIRQWVIDKPVIPYSTNGRTPSVDSLAYLITRKHVEEGQEPDYMLRDILDDMEKKYMPILEEAIAEDVTEEVNAILINGTLKGFYK